MTEDEMLKFCGEITSASRKLGIGLRESKTESGSFFYEFRDSQTKVVIRGVENRDRKIALTNACQTLVKYLDAKAA